jgi:hypothetical protein
MLLVLTAVVSLVEAVNDPPLQAGLCGEAGYLNCADVDGGGTPNIADVVILLRAINDLPASYPLN